MTAVWLIVFAGVTVYLISQLPTGAASTVAADLRTRIDAVAIAVESNSMPDGVRDIWLYRPDCAKPTPVAFCPSLFDVSAMGTIDKALLNNDVDALISKLGNQAASTAVIQSARVQEGGHSYLLVARPVTEAPVYTAVIGAAIDDPMVPDRSRRVTAAVIAALFFLLGATLSAFLVYRMVRPVWQIVQQQEDFLADAAHEMRTPLSVIQATASRMLAKDYEAKEYVSALQQIHSSAELAASGISELLDLARLNVADPALRLAPLRLDLLVEEIADTMQASGSPVEAHPGDSTVVEADLGLMRQAIVNAASNATRHASQIKLFVDTAGDLAVVHIQDNGSGFSEEMLASGFGRFRQGDRKGVAGLGLSIVKRIAELHGGAAEMLNLPDGGAEVLIKVPLRR
jgi:signal transduction histidine kinase